MEKKVKIKLILDDSLFIGHPFSRENYTTSITLSCNPGKWEGFILIDNGEVRGLELSLGSNVLNWSEERFVRKTNALLVCKGDLRQKFLDNEEDFDNIMKAAHVSRQNPEYKTFYEFSRDVKKDPLQDLEEMEKITVDLAKKYYAYRREYDDSLYSVQTKLFPFYYTFGGGIAVAKDTLETFKVNLGMTEDFKLEGIQIQQV